MRTPRDVFTYNDRLQTVKELQHQYNQKNPAGKNIDVDNDTKDEIQQFKAGTLGYRQLSKEASMWLSLESHFERRKNPIFYSNLPLLLEQETWAPLDAMLILSSVDPSEAIMEWSSKNFMGAEINSPNIKHANWFTSTSDLYDYPIVDDFEYSSSELKQLIREAEARDSSEEEREELHLELARVEKWRQDETSRFKSEMLNLRAEMVGTLKKRWDSCDHDPSQRRTPAFFVRWAESRGFDVEWAAWAREHEFLERDAPATEPPYFDADSEDYPELLHVAVRAWDHAKNGTGGTPKQRITAFVSDRYPHISDGAKEAIALIANWQKSGGRPKTGG
jgi:hypothetical protein